MEALKNTHYDAFISYRHAELDSFVAANLHKKLESFKLPKSVLGKVTSGKTRIERVFRDVDELPLSDNLSDPITNALANSDYLITICTPRYPQSQWCMKEIEVFLKTHDRKHILVVLAEDEPGNSFPEILTYEEYVSTDADGNSVTLKRELEPLAADTRGNNNKERLKAMDTAVIKLCAAMFGLNYDDLKQRHREQQLKRRAMIFGSIGAALAGFAVFATVMLIKLASANATITTQYEELQEKYAVSMVNASQELMAAGRRKDAAYALRSVLPDKKSSRHSASALKNLYSVLDVYEISGKYSPAMTYDTGAEISLYDITPDGKYVLLNDYDTVSVYDVETGVEVKSYEVSQLTEVYFCGNEGLLVNSYGTFTYEPIGDDPNKDLPFTYDYVYVFNSDSGNVTVVSAGTYIIALDARGEIIYEKELADEFGDAYSGVDVSFAEGNMIITAADYDGKNLWIGVASEETGEILWSYECKGEVAASTVGSDGKIYIATVSEGKDYIYDIAVSSRDMLTGAVVWEQKVNHDDSVATIAAGEDKLYIFGQAGYIALERADGADLTIKEIEGDVRLVWSDEGYVYYLLSDNKVYESFGNEFYEKSDFFTRKPGSEADSARFAAGSLYVYYKRANYLTRFSPCVNPFEGVSYDYDSSGSEDAYEDIINSGAVDSLLLQNALYSEDGKYVFAYFSDETGGIFDGKTFERISTFMIDDMEEMFDEYRYVKLTDCYIISGLTTSYMIDDRGEIFCVTDRIAGERDGKLVMVDDSGDGFLVPFVDYEELMSRADAYLGDYRPSDTVAAKYGIN